MTTFAWVIVSAFGLFIAWFIYDLIREQIPILP